MNGPHSPFNILPPAPNLLDGFDLMPKEGIVLHREDAIITREPVLSDDEYRRVLRTKWLNRRTESHPSKVNVPAPTLRIVSVGKIRVPQWMSAIECLRPRVFKSVQGKSRAHELVRARPLTLNILDTSTSKSKSKLKSKSQIKSKSKPHSDSNSDPEMDDDSDEEILSRIIESDRTGKRVKPAPERMVFRSADECVLGNPAVDLLLQKKNKIESTEVIVREKTHDLKLWSQVRDEMYPGRVIVHGSKEARRITEEVQNRLRLLSSKQRFVEVRVKRFDPSERHSMASQMALHDRRIMNDLWTRKIQDEIRRHALLELSRLQKSENPRLFRNTSVDKLSKHIIQTLFLIEDGVDDRKISVSPNALELLGTFTGNTCQSVFRGIKIVMYARGNKQMCQPSDVRAIDQLASEVGVAGIFQGLTQDQIMQSNLIHAKNGAHAERIRQRNMIVDEPLQVKKERRKRKREL
jgi:hypothetical protein